MRWGVVLKCGDTTEWVIRKHFLRYFLIMHECTVRTLPCKTVQNCCGGSVLLFRNGFCLFAGTDCRGLLLRVLNETHRTSNMASICYIVRRFIGYCYRNFTDLARGVTQPSGAPVTFLGQGLSPLIYNLIMLFKIASSHHHCIHLQILMTLDVTFRFKLAKQAPSRVILSATPCF